MVWGSCALVLVHGGKKSLSSQSGPELHSRVTEVMPSSEERPTEVDVLCTPKQLNKPQEN